MINLDSRDLLSRREKPATGLCLLVFLVAATWRYDLELIARVPVGELIAFVSVPFLLARCSLSKFSSRLQLVVLILCVWAFGVVISDVYNGLTLSLFARSVAKPIFVGAWMLFFVGVIVRDYRALFWYPVGGVVASLQNYFFPQSWTSDYMASAGYSEAAFGFTPIVTSVFLALGVVLYRRKPALTVLMFLLSAACLIVINAPRSSVGLMVITAVVVFYTTRINGNNRSGFSWSPGHLVALGSVFVVVSLLLVEGYVYAAANGYLGEYQQAKLEFQQSTVFGSSILGLFLAGRTPVFGAILAIFDKPFLGFGSWTGWQMTSYYYEAVSIVGTDPEHFRLAASGNYGVGHSVLFEGWLEHGVIVAFSLLFFCWVVAKETLKVIQRNTALAPFFIATAVTFMWGFLFSPFGVGTRTSIGLFSALFVTGIHHGWKHVEEGRVQREKSYGGGS